MIEAKVVFEGVYIKAGKYRITIEVLPQVYIGNEFVEYFVSIEQAIKYCLEN